MDMKRAATASSPLPSGEAAHLHCHTIEVYDGNTLVGGLYGVSLATAFFGDTIEVE